MAVMHETPRVGERADSRSELTCKEHIQGRVGA